MADRGRSSRQRLDDYYAHKWGGQQTYWAEHYPPHLRVYAHALYGRRNEEILRETGGGWEAVLDVGCGVGDLARLLAGRCRMITAVDASSTNVKTASQNLARSGVQNARVMEADAEHLPFASGSFDVVILADVLEHVPGRRRALRQARRVLRPSGRLVCVTPARVAVSVIAVPDGLALRARKLFRERTPAAPGPPAPFERFLSGTEMRDALTEAGFVDLRHRRICFYPAPDRPGVLGGAMRRLHRAVGPRRFEATAARMIRVFDSLERLRLLNQKQLWVATAP
jgi:2-polyprenyl-3-methyl-5-hydroxy-6-metoxy-1,4-benzoquinol methylase